MPVIQVKGNLFDSKAEVLVNAVNCLGVSGAGIALQFKKKFPKYEKSYRCLCAVKKVKVGHPTLHFIGGDSTTKYILSFPTKVDFRNPSKIEYIEQGLINSLPIFHDLPSNYKISVPKLGAGLGGLPEKSVILLIESIWGSLIQDVMLFV